MLSNQNNTNYNNAQQSSASSTYCLPSSNTQSGGSNTVNNNLNSYHPNKQIPYSNRCRSPSPGLFQDFDLYNFSSDTLFTTYCFEDQKDPSNTLFIILIFCKNLTNFLFYTILVFGTNPDLFQPDLMHLYPNFDFLDLDLSK